MQNALQITPEILKTIKRSYPMHGAPTFWGLQETQQQVLNSQSYPPLLFFILWRVEVQFEQDPILIAYLIENPSLCFENIIRVCLFS